MYAYQYPVHQIAPGFLPLEPSEQPVFLAVYRDSSDKVGFLELNPITAGLLDAIADNEALLPGDTLLRTLAENTNYPDADALVQHGRTMLEEMRQLEILTGTRSPA